MRENMQKAREKYQRINDRYDGFLQRAHESKHGSQAVIDALRDANALGPELTHALKEYRDAVERLADFYLLEAKGRHSGT